MNRSVLSRADIRLVVQLTLFTLSRCDLRACVIGSVAAQIHGIEYRDPKDVDLLILNAEVDQDAEEIKRRLVEMDSSHFSLTASRVSGATHCILWCTLAENHFGGPSISPMANVQVQGHGRKRVVSSSSRSSRDGASNAAQSRTKGTRTCKVDILIPSQLYMTHMTELRLYRDSENTFLAGDSRSLAISYVPLCTLLMLKLRAWVDHSLPSANEVKHGKIPEDEDDIQEILRVGMVDANLGSLSPAVEDDEMWVLGGFASWREAEQSVRRFVRKWPKTANGWRAVGFA